jgi:hypothetical protein
LGRPEALGPVDFGDYVSSVAKSQAENKEPAGTNNVPVTIHPVFYGFKPGSIVVFKGNTVKFRVINDSMGDLEYVKPPTDTLNLWK